MKNFIGLIRVKWPYDYIGPNSLTHWIIKKSLGLTDVGLLGISERVRTYGYLVLSLQASVIYRITGNTTSVFTAQEAFLNNFENVRRVDIWEDIKYHEDALSHTSSKVDYSIGENIYMLPSDMNPSIRSGTVGYNNEILV